MTPEMKDEMEIVSVPLTMLLGEKEYIDDERLDMNGFLDEVKSFTGKVGSASPPSYLYKEAIESNEDAFIVTLSEKLSGSYGSAVTGNNMAKENGNSGAHIFDSKSASAGETLVALKIFELLKAGFPKDRIIETVTRFISNMKTYFVLENYNNLQKNGRMSKVTGTIVQILSIKLIMGADGNGEIALFEKCRGVKQMLAKLVSLIERSGKETQNENLVIAHCNNSPLVEQLSTMIKERFNFKKIYIVPTGGLSSIYTDDKGIVLAF